MATPGPCNTVEEVLAQASLAFDTWGFDLVNAFPAHAYDDHPKITPGDALCLLVGNTKALWRPFTSFLAKNAEGANMLANNGDVLDSYTEHAVSRVLASSPFASVSHSVVYAHETIAGPTGRCCSVNTAGHVSGMAWYDVEYTRRSLHPRLGAWFAYRAVIVLQVPRWPAGLPAPAPYFDPPHLVLGVRPTERLAAVANRQASVVEAWGSVPESESWADLLDVTRAFRASTEGETEDEGNDEYTVQQCRFHYTSDPYVRRAVLEEEVAAIARESSASPSLQP